MRLTGSGITVGGNAVALGHTDEIKADVYHENGSADHIMIEHDRDLNEIRLTVNNECVWSTLEKE